ncbi:hypothetical protein [Microlunatus sp. GCM10028923]|uniref:AtpZ/AtpI family protein n=1 Tax=Microlunatus sp. GCM10028923 TaxID=3273400 RepID=UPI0036237A7F
MTDRNDGGSGEPPAGTPPEQPPEEDRSTSPKDRQRSDKATGTDQGLRVLSYLIAGMLFYGGLGWIGDQLLKTRFLLPIGIILGAAGAIFLIIRRYGGTPDPRNKR